MHDFRSRRGSRLFNTTNFIEVIEYEGIKNNLLKNPKFLDYIVVGSDQS